MYPPDLVMEAELVVMKAQEFIRSARLEHPAKPIIPAQSALNRCPNIQKGAATL
jgi:hypothetical protein